MEGIDREEFRDAVALLREDIRGVHTRLDTLNGRTRGAEQSIAVLQAAHRGDTRRRRSLGGAVGGLVAAIVTGLVEWLVHR